MLVAKSGSVCDFYGFPPPDPEIQVREVQAATAAIAPPGAKRVQDVVPVDSQRIGLPVGGMSSEGCQPHQPLVSFHAPACRVHHRGIQRGTWTPPPV